MSQKAKDSGATVSKKAANSGNTVSQKAKDSDATVSRKAADSGSTVSQKSADSDATVSRKAADSGSTVSQKSADSGAMVSQKATDSGATVSQKEDVDPVKVHPTVETQTPSKLISVSQSTGTMTSKSDAKPHLTPSKSTARKSVPGGTCGMKAKATARKTGQPQTMVKALFMPSHKESGGGTIKIVNFHPNSNITLKLSELEQVLKVKDPAKTYHPRGHEQVSNRDGRDSSLSVEFAKRASESPFAESSPGRESTTSDASSAGAPFGSKGHHRRRRKRGGTYDFPGIKKLPKRKRVSATAADSEFRDEDGDGDGDFEPLRKTSKKASPRRQYTMVELFKNRHFHKRQTSHDGLMRRRSGDSPLAGKKTVSQMLKERRKPGGHSSDLSPEHKAPSQSQSQSQSQPPPKDGRQRPGAQQTLLSTGPPPYDSRTVSLLLEAKRMSAEQANASPDGDKKQMVQKLFVSSTVISFCK